MSENGPNNQWVASAAWSAARLRVDLGALTANYRQMRDMAAPAECAAVVKADAYGTGVLHIVPALLHDNCRTFFVATPDEARVLRTLSHEAAIYVLNGLFPGAAPALAAVEARPILGSQAEIEEWADFCRDRGKRLPAAVHIDTGMNRLGLPPAELEAVSGNNALWEAFELSLVMSHLACADEPDHPKNADQRATFDALRARLPAAPASLANSGGVLLGPAFHYDLVRPGIALYGGNPLTDRPNPMRAVVRLEGRIAQVRQARAGETVGYGAAQTLTRPTRIATVTVGYADGYMRLAGARDGRPGASAHIGDHAAPLLGRVSMDLITLDVTDVPPDLATRGAMVELLGDHVTVDDLAAHARTIGYEVLTNLGRRYARSYEGL